MLLNQTIIGTLYSYKNMAFNFFDINSEQRFGTRIKMAPKGKKFTKFLMLQYFNAFQSRTKEIKFKEN